MSPLLLLAALVLLARLAGVAWDAEAVATWAGAIRYGLAGSFVLMGLAHFTPLRLDLVRMVPRSWPRPELLVALAGAAQIAGGAGLLLNGSKTVAAFGLAVLLLLKLPANLRAAKARLVVRGRLATPPWARLPSHVLWILLLFWVGWSP